MFILIVISDGVGTDRIDFISIDAVVSPAYQSDALSILLSIPLSREGSLHRLATHEPYWWSILLQRH